MMGSGKSTVGKLLAEKLNMQLFDTDVEIEKVMDMSINTIFDDFGENRFRMIESVFFNECIKANFYVYATGGGIVENKANHKALKNKGICFFLDCSIKQLTKRIKNDSNKRPLIKSDYKNKIENIYNKRYSMYQSCSHYTINVDNFSIKEITDKILKIINSETFK